MSWSYQERCAATPIFVDAITEGFLAQFGIHLNDFADHLERKEMRTRGAHIQSDEARRKGGRIINTATKYELKIPMNSYLPSEIDIHVDGLQIVVSGKQADREDELGTVSSQFTRRCSIPNDVDLSKMSTTFTNGNMVISIPKQSNNAIQS